jgi:lipid II:glycine glycyltransferase (peptidoglycan interpeptide bridge formation enzyme)
LIKGRRWGLKKAQKSNVSILQGPQYMKNFWEILTNNLSEKHEVLPVHSLREIETLVERFPEEILCICAQHNGVIVAGVILFVTYNTLHTQYIASNSVGREASAMDAVIEHSIFLGIKAKKRWFDFGINNENNGLILNDSLYTYKNGFGGGGYAHDFYQLVF